MILKLGVQVLGGGMLVCVAKDREGYYFTSNTDGSGKKIRLKHVGKNWKYTLPGSLVVMTAVFTDPPRSELDDR